MRKKNEEDILIEEISKLPVISSYQLGVSKEVSKQTDE